MRRGIASAGNWLIDFVKTVDRYPETGNLVTIESQQMGLGGCAHNVLVNLSKMGTGIPLYAGGCIGDDANGAFIMEEIGKHGIDNQGMSVMSGTPTSFTDVMTEKRGGARTFFHCRGANAMLDVRHIDRMKNSARIFHLGYLLLLDKLDAPDPEYGVAAARALKLLCDKGYKTSVDMVSEEGDRHSLVLTPCLPFVDYLIINEVEAGNSTGLAIRKPDGSFDPENLEAAALKLLGLGVREQVSIHLPEGGFTARKDGQSVFEESFTVGPDEIVGSVGAGDAFCAGMLYAIHEGYGTHEALVFANASARFNLFDATSTGGAPSLETIEAFIGEHSN